MREQVKRSIIRNKTGSLILLFMVCTFLPVNAQKSGALDVKLVRDDSSNRVDIIIGGKLFTSYRYPANIEKPFLYPVIAPNGSVVNRGFPIEPRKGERVDHPHHIGIWFNHGNVNGLDFWNNSSAIPAEKKDEYGHIVLQKIVKAESGKKGILEVAANWDNNKGDTLLKENTTYVFSGSDDLRIIDHITTLTAVNGPVTINDSKEGMFAIRVDRAFEMPSDEPLVFTDDKGNPTTVSVVDNTGVTGMYTSSQGLKGDAVWGTRNEWVLLTGKKDGETITMGIFDNPKNYGFPAYAHARGYGLFAMNNFGQHSYDPKKDKIKYVIEKGESVTLLHRFIVQSGKLVTPEEANTLFREFSKEY
jgi:hypothetical protein